MIADYFKFLFCELISFCIVAPITAENKVVRLVISFVRFTSFNLKCPPSGGKSFGPYLSFVNEDFYLLFVDVALMAFPVSSRIPFVKFTKVNL